MGAKAHKAAILKLVLMFFFMLDFARKIKSTTNIDELVLEEIRQYLWVALYWSRSLSLLEHSLFSPMAISCLFQYHQSKYWSFSGWHPGCEASFLLKKKQAWYLLLIFWFVSTSYHILFLCFKGKPAFIPIFTLSHLVICFKGDNSKIILSQSQCS